MHDGRIDDLLAVFGKLGGERDLASVDATCRARLQIEIDRELARGTGARSRSWAFRVPRALTAFVASVLLAGAYAAPLTHGAIESVFNSFSGWVSGDDDAAPGRALSPGDDAPPWVTAADGEKRVLAEAGGEQLVAVRSGGKLTLALADFGETGTIADLSRSVAGSDIHLVGPGRFTSARHDRRSLFGLTSHAVESIRFNYADGGPSVLAAGLDGAFGIVIDANRRPLSITGYDRSGAVISRLSFVTDPGQVSTDKVLGDFRYCPGISGCPHWSNPDQ